MNSRLPRLVLKLQALPLESQAEVDGFVDLLLTKARKEAAFDRLLAIAPALQVMDIEPMTEDQVRAEIKAARTRHHSPTGRR